MFEWTEGSDSGCSDPAGDDDVEIVLREGGTVESGLSASSEGMRLEDWDVATPVRNTTALPKSDPAEAAIIPCVLA